MGFLSVLGKIGKGALNIGTGGLAGTIMDIAGTGLGAISQAKATNRGEKLGGQMDLEQLLMARESQGAGLQSDAWRKLLAAQRVVNPGPRPQLSPYSIAPRQATQAELTGADALTRDVLARLSGPQRPLAVDPKLLDPGLMEQIAGYASPVLKTLSRIPRSTIPISYNPGSRAFASPYNIGSGNLNG
jgi:hypothetical protein